jgi:hypothetical protein
MSEWQPSDELLAKSREFVIRVVIAQWGQSLDAETLDVLTKRVAKAIGKQRSDPPKTESGE